jgi:hypothetical protein
VHSFCAVHFFYFFFIPNVPFFIPLLWDQSVAGYDWIEIRVKAGVDTGSPRTKSLHTAWMKSSTERPARAAAPHRSDSALLKFDFDPPRTRLADHIKSTTYDKNCACVESNE